VAADDGAGGLREGDDARGTIGRLEPRAICTCCAASRSGVSTSSASSRSSSATPAIQAPNAA
jgi:hypothetical protein